MHRFYTKNVKAVKYCSASSTSHKKIVHEKKQSESVKKSTINAAK